MAEYIITENPDYPYEEPKPHELIRCKDCKYYVPDDYNCMQMDTGGWIYNPDDYCSFAEKK